MPIESSEVKAQESTVPEVNQQSTIKLDTSHVDDGSSSTKDLNKEIEVMRARVELQLKNLMKGTDMDQIRQQVADLRTVTPPEGETHHIAQEDSSISSKITPIDLRSSNNSSSSELDENILRKRNRLEQLLTKTAPKEDDNKTSYVENEVVMDPYGDKGSYTGETDSKIKPHGLGTMDYNDGRKYTGSWNHGQWHGQGE